VAGALAVRPAAGDPVVAAAVASPVWGTIVGPLVSGFFSSAIVPHHELPNG
jgi:hypothetical protein